MHDVGEGLPFAAVFERASALLTTCMYWSAESSHTLGIDVPVEVFRIETDFATYPNCGEFTALPEASYVPRAVVEVLRCAFEVQETSSSCGRWRWARGHFVPPSLDRPETDMECCLAPGHFTTMVKTQAPQRVPDRKEIMS